MERGLKMDPSMIMQAIGSVGFPIVAACAMFYLYDKTIKELTETLTRIDTTMQVILKQIERSEEQ